MKIRGRTKPPWASRRSWVILSGWALFKGWDQIDLLLLGSLAEAVKRKHPEWTDEQRSRLVEGAWGIHLEHVKSRE